MQVSTSGLAIVSCGGMVTSRGADTSTSTSTSTKPTTKATRTPAPAPLMKFQARVNGRDATVLLDSGSSSNFISAEYAKAHKLRSKRLENEQVVTLADGTEYRVNRAVLNAFVCWNGWQGRVSLLLLPLSGNDAILGMAWLTKYNPSIDWNTGQLRVAVTTAAAAAAAAPVAGINPSQTQPDSTGTQRLN